MSFESTPKGATSLSPITISGHQPGYHMYVGVAAKLLASDLFILADNMDFRRQKFQHRQLFPSHNQRKWLTIPVARSAHGTSIAQRHIVRTTNWQEDHLAAIRSGLGGMPHFAEVDDFLTEIYRIPWLTLADINTALWSHISKLLRPTVPVVRSSQLPLRGWTGKGARIADEISLFGDRGVYLAGAASGYLLLASDCEADKRHVDVIGEVGFRVEQVWIDSGEWALRSPLPPNASALEAIAAHGVAAVADLIRECTRLTTIH